MAFIDRLKDARKNAGMTQEKLAQKIGVAKSTYTGYEKGNSEPNMYVLSKIMEALNVDANYLYQDEVKAMHDTRATPHEMEHLVKKYRLLDPYGKEAVDGVLDVEWRRCESVRATALQESRRQAEAAMELMPEVVEMLVYVNPAAAGTPLYAESDFERLEFPADEVPRGADFGIRISGRSMEPTVMDGAIAWVRKRLDFLDGTVGVFMLNDSAVCKRFFKSGDSVILESDNPEFGPVPVTEFDTFVPVGEVIGTI